MASKTLPFPTAWQSVPDIPHLRQLHIDLEKAVAGVGRAYPLHTICQVRLAQLISNLKILSYRSHRISDKFLFRWYSPWSLNLANHQANNVGNRHQ